MSRKTDTSKHFSSDDIQNSLGNLPNQSESWGQNAKIKLLELWPVVSVSRPVSSDMLGQFPRPAGLRVSDSDGDAARSPARVSRDAG